MKIRFQNTDNIKKFVEKASKLKIDVIVTNGNMIRDGKSPVGMMNFSPESELSVTIIAKDNNDAETFCKYVKDMGIITRC